MSFAFSFQKITQDGERAEAEKDLLPPPHVQVAQAVQSDPVQEVGRVEVCPGKEEVWSQAARVRRSVEADPEEEGEDHEEAGPQDGVHRVQVEEPGKSTEKQILV